MRAGSNANCGAKKCGMDENTCRQSLNFGGAERDRTADLLVANEALSQLSYSPMGDFLILSAAAGWGKAGLDDNPLSAAVGKCAADIGGILQGVNGKHRSVLA
jgi:hypothetical protein